MKALMQAKAGLGTLGYYYVEFKPIHDDWLSWKTAEGELKLIHEKCYYAIAINHKAGLGALGGEGICARCGVEAPSTVQQFVLLANGVRGYENTTNKRDNIK